MNMKKIITIFIIVSVTTTVFLTACTESSNSNSVFLNHKISISGQKDDKTIINLIFIDDKYKPKIKQILDKANKITFLNADGITVNKLEVADGDDYKDMSLYSLSLEINYSSPGTYKADKLAVYFNDGSIIYYPIGESDFNVFDNHENNFDINSHTSLSTTLSSYSFALTSISPRKIIIQDIDLGNFEEYKKDVITLINGKEVDDLSNIPLNKGDKVDVKITFNDSNKYDIYCFNPVLRYEKDNKMYVYTPIYTMYGMPINETKIKGIYQKYKEVSK